MHWDDIMALYYFRSGWGGVQNVGGARAIRKSMCNSVLCFAQRRRLWGGGGGRGGTVAPNENVGGQTYRFAPQ